MHVTVRDKALGVSSTDPGIAHGPSIPCSSSCSVTRMHHTLILLPRHPPSMPPLATRLPCTLKPTAATVSLCPASSQVDREPAVFSYASWPTCSRRVNNKCM